MINQIAATRLASNPSFRRGSLLMLALLLATVQTGCISVRTMMVGRQPDPMAGAPRLQNCNNPRIEEVVAHLNQNTDRIQSWRSNSVKIHANQWSLSGTLAVEKGRHVRLVVSSPLGNEVDLGSNDERFWVWSRRMDPAFVTCKHENMDVARQALGVPFEPDWLMEALGVAPLPTTGVTMEADPSNRQARLVQQVTTAHGRPLRRVVLVDLKRGIVVEHSLYDYDGKRVALAKLGGHRLDKASGVVLPHRVMLDWPQTQMSMTMEINKIQINPSSIPNQVWKMPDLPGFEVVQLDEGVPAARIAIHSESGVSLDSIEMSDADESEAEGEPRDADLAGHSTLSDDSDEPDSDWAK